MGARTLRNPKTGETITVLKTARETQGELFQMSYRMSPHAAIADVHSHPNQEMTINVMSGTLTCTLDGVDRDIKAGETVTIPAGVLHFQRNDTDDEVHAIEEYRPALQMQEFFEVLIGWANDGKTNAVGMPSLLRRAILHRYFHRSIRSASRKTNLESRLLAPVAMMLGYRRELERYLRPD
jgi:quercetin dioxygenase-like cupin family protein